MCWVSKGNHPEMNVYIPRINRVRGPSFSSPYGLGAKCAEHKIEKRKRKNEDP